MSLTVVGVSNFDHSNTNNKLFDLIQISLITQNTEHIFKFINHMHVFFVKIPV